MAMSPAEAGRRWLELKAFVQEVMIEGTDYGKSFATQPQPSLWQQGAQKLAELYGFSHRFEWVEVVKDWKEMFFYFECKCILRSRRTGEDIGEGIGSCNSKESKYAYRWAYKSEVPSHMDLSKMRQKTLESKKTGKPYTVYRVDNDDMASQVNTLQKMAAKRAYVHAVISVTRSSGLFTQDAEDLPEEAFGVVDEERTWERGSDALEAALQRKESSGTGGKQDASPGPKSEVASTPVDGGNPSPVEDKPKPQGAMTGSGGGGERPASKPIAVTMPKPATKAKPTAPEPPFGDAKQEEVSQKESAPQTALPVSQPTPTGPLPSPSPAPEVDWSSEVDRIKNWITEAYKQTEPGPRETVKSLVKRFIEGPPFPPSEIADDLKRFFKMTSGAK
jgi:hypothetical protein